MRCAILLGLGILPGCVATAAHACERDIPPVVKLPGESDTDAYRREENIRQMLAASYQVVTEENYSKTAPTIYAAKVVRNADGDNTNGVVVQPLKAYKGSLPKAERKLLVYPASLCGGEMSDGDGWRGKPNELVLVIEGLTQSEYRPNGIDSFQATSVKSREFRLWLDQFGTPIANDND